MSSTTNAERVDVLLQALPYIERFRGSVVVVKFGGNAMTSPELFESFASDIVWMHRVGIRPIVVHGGGPQIGQWLARLGRESTFVDGRRVTDAETLEVAQMVLIGKVNSDIVTALNAHGPVAVGLSGTDASMLAAEAHAPELGFVGAVTEVHPELIERTLSMDLVPVLATIGVDADGQTYNINADDAATAVAKELGAEKLIFLSDVPGLLTDVDDPASLVAEVGTDTVRSYISDGTISGGMVPKMAGCVEAVEAGVGTMVVGSAS
jgi:acetylglutamate kinase